ncbi:MAG: carboxypeptidase regulatory-like domain-containing protein [Acidobacteria bacterium]|nr:carboxypeptidase regulatory-like domain-containing protein [Acidobacteriota bacterium]
MTCLILFATAPLFAQGEQGKLTGRVTDDSGAVLPGVAVAIVSPRLRGPVIVVTDEAGHYSSPPLAPGAHSVTFELAGFETLGSAGIALRAGEVFVLDARLNLAPVSERVEVVASAPPMDPPRSRIRPRIQTDPVPEEALASVCGPGQPRGIDAALGKIVGHRDEKERTLFGDNDVLLLDVGEKAGASIGQNYVVRRRFRIGDKSLPIQHASFGEDTAGLVQVVAIAARSSTAVVVYACGEFFAGDTVELFEPLPALIAQANGTAQYEDPAHIIFGEHGKEMGAPRQLMVIDRGTAGGAQRGQRLTVFRHAVRGRGPVATVAEAVIVAVREHSATIRIDRATDAVTVGDLVALHRQPPH